MTTSVVVIGLGNIGMLYDIDLPKDQNVLTHCSAFSLHPDFELIGAIETNPKNRTLFEKKYELPSFNDIESYLKSHGLAPDIFVVANPTESHLLTIEEIIEVSNPKAILCEKPLAYDTDEAEKIKKICDDNNIEIFLNFIRRADPGILELKNRLDSHQIQGPFKLVAWYSKGLIHNGSHFIDLFDFLFGSISSFKIINPGPKKGKEAEPDFLVEYMNATVFFNAVNAEHFSYHKFDLVASNGFLSYEENGNLIWRAAEKNKVYGNIPLSDEEEIIFGDMRNYQYNVLSMLSEALNKGDHFLCDGVSGLQNIAILNKIISSI